MLPSESLDYDFESVKALLTPTQYHLVGSLVMTYVANRLKGQVLTQIEACGLRPSQEVAVKGIMGRIIKETYDNFLNDLYKNNVIREISSDELTLVPSRDLPNLILQLENCKSNLAFNSKEARTFDDLIELLHKVLVEYQPTNS